jgi:iron uptake system EfeUOB component EfeO/EfeM
VLRRLSRASLAGSLFAATVIVGLVVFTALGLGGEDDGHGRPASVPVRPTGSVYVPHKLPPGRAGLSESIGAREGGYSNDPATPILNENPPIAPARFKGPIRAYRHYAGVQAKRMGPEVDRLRAAVGAGDRTRARAAWRVAFDRYLRLGAVYGAFGDLDAAIDGLPGGLPGGVHDKGFTGLHRIELTLWSGEPVRSALPAVRRLRTDVGRLRTTIRTAQITSLDYATRAHEILEDAQRDFLSGTHVPWSGEGVLATASGVAATQEVLDTLHPLLKGVAPDVTAPAGLDRVRATLTRIRRAHGGRLPPLPALRHTERAELAGSLGWALEQLQSVPGALETTDPPAIPTLK